MKYEIFGDSLPALSIKMDKGESIYTQSGGMTWMDATIKMETNMSGGLMKGIGRMFGGESLFMVTYSSQAPDSEIVLGSTFPGRILALDISKNRELVCQKTAFMAATPGVDLNIEFTRKLSSGLFGGEGFILQKISGEGLVFIEIGGTLVERELAPGETLLVDTGNVAAFERGVGYEVEMVKGFKNIFFGGEGLFLTKLKGPGKVWLQSMTVSELAHRIIPYIPSGK